MLSNNEFIDWIIKGVLAISFAGWAALIRYFGQKYIATQEEITEKLAEINTRLAVLEAQQKQKE